MADNKNNNKTKNQSEKEVANPADNDVKDQNAEGVVEEQKESTGQQTATGEKSGQSRMEKLRSRTKAANEKALSNSLKNMELFDTTKATDWNTTGSRSLGFVKTNDKDVLVSGRNIGAEQREPDWTTEQMKAIREAVATTLQVVNVTHTRRSIMDAAQNYVGQDEKGTIVPKEEAYVSSLSPSVYAVGVGSRRYDTTGSPRFYADAVISSMDGSWMVNQWTSEGIVLEGVAMNVLMQQSRTGNTSGRRIGYHFARIGLPKYAFGPLFNTLDTNCPGIMAQVSQTPGYYWMNASWGVSSFGGVFTYKGDNGLEKTTNLLDVMQMLNGMSYLCLGTLAISITCGAKMDNGKPVADDSTYGLSVKLHNAFGVAKVDYHGPPQQASTGMTIPSRIMESAQVITRGPVARPNAGGGMFQSTNKGLFGNVTAAPPTIKSSDQGSYM